jgi:predicted secreted Zn-dependent protease
VVLPPLDPQNARIYDGTRDVELTVDGVEGLSMLVKAGSMRLPGGVVPGPENPAVLSLNQVHHDDVPMPMPDGAAPPFAWTLQPAGAAFDPPIQVRYPNMSGLAPGAVAYFLSFDHDTDRFEIVASGHVVADGSSIVTDPGAGLDKAGWGCNCPPYSITGDCDACPEGDGAGASNQDRCRPCRKEDKVTPGKNGSPGAAQTSPNRSEITYRVGGTTLTEVLANMLSGPNAPHAAKTSCQFPGSTPEAEVRGKKLSDGGRGHYWEVELTVKRFEIQADIEVSLPDWTGRSGDTCRQRTDEWDRFLGKLRAHEERHVDLCKASLERRGKEVMALKLTAVSCDFNQALKLLADAFNAALQRITAAEDQRLQKDHDDFDRQTNHGNTPGDAHLDTSKDASCPP